MIAVLAPMALNFSIVRLELDLTDLWGLILSLKQLNKNSNRKITELYYTIFILHTHNR